MPSGRDIIAVILGASEWPSYNTLDGAKAFYRSAVRFQKYLRSNLGLPRLNIKEIFDKELQPGDVINEIRTFIRERTLNNTNVSDVIFYYVGHGGYIGNEYFLALRTTERNSKEATVFKTSYLREIVADLTFDKRNIIIIDACYSAAAVGDLVRMSVPSGAKGTVLLCAAAAKNFAKAPAEADLTMFTGALMQVLEQGDPTLDQHLSIRDVVRLTVKKIRDQFGDEGVHPQVHIPVQDAEDIGSVPYFPNAAITDYGIEDRFEQIDFNFKSIERKIDHLIEGFSSSMAFNKSKSAMDSNVNQMIPPLILRALNDDQSASQRYKSIAVAALKEHYGLHTDTPGIPTGELIRYVIENVFDKNCAADSVIGDTQVSNVTISSSDLEGHFTWDEIKSYNVYCPKAGIGSNVEHVVGANTSYVVHQDKVFDALNKTNFTVILDGKYNTPVFNFEKWWRKLEVKSIKSDFLHEDSDVRLIYDGQQVSLNLKKNIKLNKTLTHISIYEKSYLSHQDRSYSLAISRPTRGLNFTMRIDGSCKWVLKEPMISAQHYHREAQNFAEVASYNPKSVFVKIPGWILPGLALVIEWAPD